MNIPRLRTSFLLRCLINPDALADSLAFDAGEPTSKNFVGSLALEIVKREMEQEIDRRIPVPNE